MKSISRRRLIQGMVAVPAAAALSTGFHEEARAQDRSPRSLAATGWCWDGQGFGGGVNPSIFGAGEGTRWFGLEKTAYMFHPNTELALEKLHDFKEVICEISKWKVRRCENGVAHYLAGDIDTKRREAAAVGRLSRRFANVSGAIDDDLLGIIRREGIKPEQYATVYEALKDENPKLKLWTVVYDRELDAKHWAGFEPFMDVVNLCVGNQTEDFSSLGKYLDQCEELFPGKPVNLVYRLRDFGFKPVDGVRIDLLEQHWKDIRKYIAEGRLSGYSILGGFLIDMHPEQAKWLREFIASG